MAITVSTKWKEAIQAQFRYPGYLKFDLTVQPPGIREEAQVSSTSTYSKTTESSIVDGNQNHDDRISTLELNRWTLDGSFNLDREQPLNLSWWSDILLSTGPVRLTFTFDKVYSVAGMNIVWDKTQGTFPGTIVVEGFSASGDSTAGPYTLTATSYTEYFDAPLNDVAKVTLTINDWSVPRWRARIAEVVFGPTVQFSNDSLKSAKLTASTKLLSSELPQLGLELEVNDYDRVFDPMLITGYSKYLTERQVVNVSWGFDVGQGNIEWMDSWPLYLKAWKIPSDSPTVKLSTTSRVSFLTTKYSKGVYTGVPKTFAELAKEVLNDSNIIKSFDNEMPWELDSVLNTLQTRAPAPEESYNAVLQLIANAAGCVMDINPVNNYVRIRQNGAMTDYEITEMQQIGDPAYTIEDRLKRVSVGLRTFATREEVAQVYSFEGTVAGSKVLDIHFDSNNIVLNPVATITGATITSQVYYARSAVITVVAAAAGAEVTLIIKGNIVDESTTFIQTYNNADIDSGIEVQIDNPLITEIATLNRVAEVTKEYYLRRKHVTAKYTGYPELETADTVEFATNYGSFDAEIEKLTLSFNGGFNGTIKAVSKHQ